MTPTNLRNYLYLARRFRNGPALIQAYRRRRPIGEAVEWSGRRLQHPPASGGLVGTLLEVWREGCYDDLGSLRPGDVVVDAGAHVGLFSIRVAARAPGVRVIAYEPSAENNACLRANLGAYGVADRVEVHRSAVGGRRQLVRLQACTARSIDHRAVPAGPDDADAVPTVTLDEIVAAAGGEVAFLKMDVEGAEHEAFERALPGTLSALRRVALEYHDNLVPGTLALLQRRLQPTHTVRVVPTEQRGYGLLYAWRRD